MAENRPESKHSIEGYMPPVGVGGDMSYSDTVAHLLASTTTMKQAVKDVADLDEMKIANRNLRREGFGIPTVTTLLLALEWFVGTPRAGWTATVASVEWVRESMRTATFSADRITCGEAECDGWHRLDALSRWWNECNKCASSVLGEIALRPHVSAAWEPRITGMIGLRLVPKVRGEWWEKEGPLCRMVAVWRKGLIRSGVNVKVWQYAGLRAEDVAYYLTRLGQHDEAATYRAMPPRAPVWRTLVFVDAYHPRGYVTEVAADVAYADALRESGLKVRDTPRTQPA